MGDFAFALWDESRQSLWGARDHFGVVPLYYASVRGDIICSNTLDALRLHPDVSGELNERAIADTLFFGSNQEADTTIFSQIRALPAAHTLALCQGVP